MAAPRVNIADLLTIQDAASFLGVSASTLRNWDRKGKLVPVRNPINGYRLYRRAELEQLLAALEGGHSHDPIDVERDRYAERGSSGGQPPKQTQ